jgi:hypothetical protein
VGFKQLTGQTLGATVAGKQIEIDLRLTKFGMLCGYDVRASQNQLVSAAQCGAVDRGNDGDIEIFKRRKCGLRRIRQSPRRL